MFDVVLTALKRVRYFLAVRVVWLAVVSFAPIVPHIKHPRADHALRDGHDRIVLIQLRHSSFV